MLFNSYLFLFLFLPVALAGYYLLGTVRLGWAALWLCILGLLGVFAVGYPGYFVFRCDLGEFLLLARRRRQTAKDRAGVPGGL